jgi:hypothetical protein
MSRKLSSMPSRCPPAVSPQPDNGVGSFAAPQRLPCVGKASTPQAPRVVGDSLVLRDRDVRRHLRGRRGNAEMSALVRLCREELNEQHAAVVDRDELCWRVGRRLLRRLGL